MADSMKWKDKLLSSSVPMEYEVAKKLVELGFAVGTDYAYSRDDHGVVKDFSVDINATSYVPFDNENEVDAVVELLVECKQRHQNNRWLFFEDPNRPDMSHFTLGYTIRAVDDFSPYLFEANATVEFDEEVICCSKGLDMDLGNGAVHDSEIRHGLLQLQYAIPRLLSDSIFHNVMGHEEDNKPFFFCPILLTTSPILVAKQNTTIESVSQATCIEDIAEPRPYVVVQTDISPNFERHRQSTLMDLKNVLGSFNIERVDCLREQAGEYEFLLPVRQIENLMGPDGRQFGKYFSQVVVCSLDSFPELVERIKSVCDKTVKEMKSCNSQ